jgi:sterol 14alpha-demethylase
MQMLVSVGLQHCLKLTTHITIDSCRRQVYKFNVPTFGPGVVYDVDVSVRTEQIRFFAESLKTEKLKSYVPLFVQEAEVNWMLECTDGAQLLQGPCPLAADLDVQTPLCILYAIEQAFFAKWDNEGTVDLKDELSELIILTASRTLMGECAAF